MKRNGKRFFTTMLAIIMVMSLMTLPAFAAPATMDDTATLNATPASDPPVDVAGIVIPAGFGLIAGLSYALAEVIKRSTSVNTARLPVILTFFGLGMGIVLVLFNPEVRLDPAASWQDTGWAVLKGAVYGCMSSLSAVGINQIVKQGAKLKAQTTSETGV